jgi:hypothetical protein
VLYSTNEHWMSFLPAIAAWIVAVAFLVLWRLVAADALMLVCLALAAVAGLAALYWTTACSTADHRDRCHQRAGRPQDRFHQAADLRDELDKVESVDVNQSILGRLAGTRRPAIQGVGEGTQTISAIASPLAFRNAITTRPVGT